MAPKVAIIIYSLYQHIVKLAEVQKIGIETAGGTATIFQVAETLPTEVLAKFGAPPKPDYPIATNETLAEYDGYLFGIASRFGAYPAQFKAFFDATGQLWMAGALQGKHAGFFVSTGVSGGGQENVITSSLSLLAHHGIIYVPLGGKATSEHTTPDELRGGSPWGAGTFAGPNGSRVPTKDELGLAEAQGKLFWETVARAYK